MVFKNFAMKSLPWKCLLFCFGYKFFFLISVTYKGVAEVICEGILSVKEKGSLQVWWGEQHPLMGEGMRSCPFSVPFEKSSPSGCLHSLPECAELAGSDRMETPWVAFKQLFWLQGVVWLWQFGAQQKQLIYLPTQPLCLDDTLEHTHCLQKSRILVSLPLWRTRIWPLLCKTVSFVVVSCELVFLYHVWATK